MKKNVFALCSVIIFVLLGGCSQGNDDELFKGNLMFGFDVFENEDLGLKSAILSNDVDGVYISIKKDGQYLDGYNHSRFDLTKLFDSYITSAIELEEGVYTVEEFLVVDKENAAIYITPKVGSMFESYVNNPLPYDFTISEGDTTGVVLQVVDVNSGASAADFGYATFDFDLVSTDTAESIKMVKDIDNNVYNVMQIGKQYWMTDNLKTTKYNDGTPIKYITESSNWSNPDGSFCYYNHNTNNADSLGALYNWYTVETGKLCPTGWHIPSDSEWSEMENYMAMNGYNYKTIDIFSTYGGRCLGDFGNFALQGTHSTWWTSTKDSDYSAYYRGISHTDTTAERWTEVHTFGFSVRCIKD